MRMSCPVINDCTYATFYSELSPLAHFWLQVQSTVIEYAAVSKPCSVLDSK